MRSRKDAIEPCDESLQNDDRKWMEKVVGIIGCFPCYWQDIFINFTSFKLCKTPNELKKASKYLPRNNEKTTKSVLSMYTQPCDQMRVNINSNSDRYDDDTIFKIKFRFSSDFIDETRNVRSFEKANLWASIGGYVGMILGFSFLNVPDIVLNMINYVKSKALISNESASFNKDIQQKV